MNQNETELKENTATESQTNQNFAGQKVINISSKLFVSVLIILFSMIVLASILTYVLPKGHFSVVGENIDYSSFVVDENASGIAIWKALLSPILVIATDGGIGLVMLSIFLVVVSGAFQIMSDNGGIESIVGRIVRSCGNKKKLLLAIIVLIFMVFGAFFGLFEETLALLPFIIVLAISLGYDSYTAFLICTVATGFGFASAITNPFTVLFASKIVGASIFSGIWLRLIVFAIMYAVLLCFVFLHTSKISKDMSKSPSYEADKQKIDFYKQQFCIEDKVNKKKFVTYTTFLLFVFFSIILATSLPFLRDFTVIVLIVIFLFGGFICGFIVEKDKKSVFKSALKGYLACLPAIAMIFLASAVKYILLEGNILDTITNYINLAMKNQNAYLSILCLFGIVLILEFFISSSTAKAVFVMGILGGIIASGTLGISRELVVLTYIFSDGYTNVLFPTSPVLLIALANCNVSYGKWFKKSIPLFLITFAIAIAILLFAVFIHY